MMNQQPKKRFWHSTSKMHFIIFSPFSEEYFSKLVCHLSQNLSCVLMDNKLIYAPPIIYK